MLLPLQLGELILSGPITGQELDPLVDGTFEILECQRIDGGAALIR